MADKKDNSANGENPQPANMPLFYKQPLPLDAKKHEKLALKENFGFEFTRGVNAVPVNLIEMAQICHFYPIAFSPDGRATPVAIMGLRDNENLFLQADSSWEKNCYIPAYIRRYPFIFSEVPDTEQLTLCVDMDDKIVSEKGAQRFFDDEGKPTKLAEGALNFCKSYHAAAQETLKFSEALAKSGILVDRETQIRVGEDKRINFSGFQIIDEKKLKELDDKTFLEWREKGWLPFVYAHLLSGAQWDRLAFMLNQIMEKEAA
ncbi:MAG: SapC family protein [Micavibrio sp.]|nr:SapC family protein [Micavibrio sp.]